MSEPLSQPVSEDGMLLHVGVMQPSDAVRALVGHACDLRLKKGETVRTEELRTAMVHYRSLFDELVQAHTGELRQAAE